LKINGKKELEFKDQRKKVEVAETFSILKSECLVAES
jgi:hypothetical protein